MAYLKNDIYIGSLENPLYHFQNSDTDGGSNEGTFSVNVIGNELAIDQFSVTVHQDGSHVGFYDVNDNLFITSDDQEFEVIAAEGEGVDLKSYMSEVPYGTPVWWYVENVFYAKGYLKSIDRVTKHGFKLTCISGVGLLDTTMHTGGIYQSTAISTVLASIIGGAFPYTVSNEVAATTVSGRLPYDTRRNNLHRLLFATGAALIKDDDTNDYDIEYLGTTVIDVPSSRIALQGSIQRQLPSNKVEVTEHQFFADAMQPTETLFDNTAEAAAVNLLVVFDAAVVESTLAATGTLTISSSGANFAVVSGNGTLTGKYYVHTTNVMEIENNPSNAPERVRRVTDCELVTAVNSYNVARRVLSYFQSAKTVKARILMENERCGQLLQFYDAFGDLTKGYLSKADTLVTSVIGANCELIDGYVPGNNGNNYLHRAAITQDGTWTVPDGVTRIRIVLIGGGDGGSGGYDGQRGMGGAESYGGNLRYIDEGQIATYFYYGGNQESKKGGAGAAGGLGGKVWIADITVSDGDTLNFTIGAGGVGGARNGTAGAAGGDTSVSGGATASSANGQRVNGYVDPFTGDTFALGGIVGIAGGDGGLTDTIDTYAYKGGDGLQGQSVGEYAGGAGGLADNSEAWATISGGGGGGAAYGTNGGAGGNAYRLDFSVRGGNGGAGANALAPAKASYGNGGNGGNGGGAGGNGAGAIGLGSDWSSGSVGAGSPGEAGLGSAGGDGGDGIAIIYW